MKNQFFYSCLLLIGSFLCITGAISQAPTIGSFAPSSGPIGTLVTIKGTNLNNTTNVKIGGVSAIQISKRDSVIVAMVMPAAVSGNIFITSTEGNGTSSTFFTITASSAPKIQQGSKLVGGNSTYCHQGTSVDISADGNTAIVGSPEEDMTDGGAWIFVRTNGIWNTQGTKLLGIGGDKGSRQGTSVAISADGNTAIIGGIYDGVSTAGPIHPGSIGGSINTSIGGSDGGSIGASWVFVRNNNTWSQQGQKLVGTGYVGLPRQGTSISISADGNTTIIGGSNDNNGIGAAWLFVRFNGVWKQQGQKLVGTGYSGKPNQGTSVAISANGNTAIVGGSNDSSQVGAAWIFVRNNNTWSQQSQKLMPIGADKETHTLLFGQSVCLSADGNTAIVGGYGDFHEGASWIFVRNDRTWSQQGAKLVAHSNDVIGVSQLQAYSVHLNADGNIAIVGSPGDVNGAGSAFIFVRSNGNWNVQETKLKGTQNVGLPVLGTSISISADGTTAIGGGFADNSQRGASWIFVRQ